MSKERCRQLVAIGDKMFSSRGGLISLWQEIAEHFDPERADFNGSHAMGSDFAAHLMTGFPAVQARELADNLAAMLRPRSRLWAKLTASDQRIKDDQASQQWLEEKSEQQRRYMYALKAQFLRATKRADYDFVDFGNAVLLVGLNRERDGLLYRCFHLRDTAWYEDYDGQVCAVHRKEKRCAVDLVKYFPATVSEDVRRVVKEDPYKEFECRHIVVPAEQYETEKKPRNQERFPYYSIWLDTVNDTILEELPQRRLGYVIPRWRLGAFAQYATSPCTMLSLPDSRLLQTMTLALLEAAEKGANPPMIATMDVVRSDIAQYPGGVTWVDKSYDERLGEAMRPVTQDMRGLQFGLKMLEDVREQLKHTFFLNKLNLPEMRDMTAFETKKRVEEYVRSALPLFEPMEVEYNTAICNETFQLLLDNNGFGPIDQMPEALRGADVAFEFESPLQATAKRSKAEAAREAAPIIEAGLALDPTTKHIVDVHEMERDALDGVEVPSKWLRDRKAVEQRVAEESKALAAQAQMREVAEGAAVAEQVGNAAQALAG